MPDSSSLNFLYVSSHQNSSERAARDLCLIKEIDSSSCNEIIEAYNRCLISEGFEIATTELL